VRRNKVDNIQELLVSLNSRVEALEKSLEEIKKEVKQCITSIEDLNRRVIELEKREGVYPYPEYALCTVNEVDIRGKTVLLIADLDVPYTDRPHIKFIRFAETVKEIIERGAKVIVLAYQGVAPTSLPWGTPREKGFDGHINAIRETIERHYTAGQCNIVEISSIRGLLDDSTRNYIINIKEGRERVNVLLLGNFVIYCGEELLIKDPRNYQDAVLVKDYSKLLDAYVLDNLEVAIKHSLLSTGLVQGFAEKRKPCLVGRSLMREIEILESFRRKLEEYRIKGGRVLIIGGARPHKAATLIETLLTRSLFDKVLTGGYVGLALVDCTEGSNTLIRGMIATALLNEGVSDYEKEMELLQDILQKFKGLVMYPKDVAFKDGQTRKSLPVGPMLRGRAIEAGDIGDETINAYKKELERSTIVFFCGVLGKYQDRIFAKGSSCLLDFLLKKQEEGIEVAIAGKHLTSVLQTLVKSSKYSGELPFAFRNGFASLHVLAGELAPGLEALSQICKNSKLSNDQV